MFQLTVAKYRDHDTKGRDRETDRLARLDALPHREKMGAASHKRRYTGNTSCILRWLQAQIGRPWNDVHSEALATTPKNSLERIALEKNLGTWVELHIVEEDGVIYGQGAFRATELRSGDMYVRNGIICRIPIQKVSKPSPTLRVTFTEQMKGIGQSNGQWFMVEFAEYVSNPNKFGTDMGRYDVFLKDTVTARGVMIAYGKVVIAVNKRAMSKREIRIFRDGI